MPTCRPEINEDLVRKIKATFPETAMMGIAETIEWAIKKAVAYKKLEEAKKQ